MAGNTAQHGRAFVVYGPVQLGHAEEGIPLSGYDALPGEAPQWVVAQGAGPQRAIQVVLQVGL